MSNQFFFNCLKIYLYLTILIMDHIFSFQKFSLCRRIWSQTWLIRWTTLYITYYRKYTTEVSSFPLWIWIIQHDWYAVRLVFTNFLKTSFLGYWASWAFWPKARAKNEPKRAEPRLRYNTNIYLPICNLRFRTMCFFFLIFVRFICE